MILEALISLKKLGATADIASKAKLNVNGVARSLRALMEFVRPGPAAGGGKQTWKLVRDPPRLTKPLWSKLNSRRVFLIGREVDKTITPDEQAELNDLQETASRYVDRDSSLEPAIRRLKRLQTKFKVK